MCCNVLFNVNLIHPPGISEFINRGTQATSKFESLVNQIQKNERDIDSKLNYIESANLFKFPAMDKTGDLPGGMSINLIHYQINVCCNQCLL